MAMACMRALVISIIFLASIRLPMVMAAVSEEAPESGSYQFELIHVDANGNFSREELIRRALNRSRLRAAMLSAAAEDEDVDDTKESFSSLAQYSPKTYMMELKMGLPETTLLAVADSGSDLIWTNQLRKCIGNPSFTPTNASCSNACLHEKKPLQCNTCIFNKTYGGGNITGFTGTETVSLATGTGTFKQEQVDLVCAIAWSEKMLPKDGQGIVGLSQGRKSLVRQLRVTQFSYCLQDPHDPTKKSPLWFGANAQSAAGGADGWMTTDLVEISTELSQQPEWAKNDYYVALDEICIDGKCSGPLKPEDFRLKSSDGGKGLMLVDSGNTYMQLDNKIFDALSKTLYLALGVKVVKKEDMYCFDTAPKCKHDHPSCNYKHDLVLKFPGADMSIPWASYVEEGQKDFCLYILKKTVSILGNFQQQNVPMLYDLAKKKLSFKRRDCSSTN